MSRLPAPVEVFSAMQPCTFLCIMPDESVSTLARRIGVLMHRMWIDETTFEHRRSAAVAG